MFLLQEIQYQEQGNIAFKLLVKSHTQDKGINLEEVMKYTLVSIPPSLGTQDGFFSKTNKAAILHYLLEDSSKEQLNSPDDALFIFDGMALIHTLTNLPPTCGEIALQILDHIKSKKHFLFSTDSYHSESIKSQERLRRGTSDKIILGGPCTRKPYDFKAFLANDENKSQLCELLLHVWGNEEAASRLKETENAMLIVQGKAFSFHIDKGKVSIISIRNKTSNIIH